MTSIATLIAPDATPTLVQERLLAALAAAGGQTVPFDALIAAMGCKPVSLRVHVQHTRRLLADGVKIVAKTGVGYAVEIGRPAATVPAQRKGTRWSPSLDAVLRRGVAEGKTFAEIGAAVGRTPAAVESRMQRLGIAYANNTARMERMFRDRWARASTIIEVTTALKITRDSAAALAERLGLPPLPTGEIVRPAVPSRPQGITKAQIAWAIANFRTSPEAKFIALMVESQDGACRRVVGAEA